MITAQPHEKYLNRMSQSSKKRTINIPNAPFGYSGKEIKMRYIFIGLLLLPFVYTNSISAEDDVFSQLLRAKCLKCSFEEGVSTSWHAKGVKIESDQWKGDTIFDSIDIKNGRARNIGNQGSADAIVIGSPAGITFIEKTGSGNMVFTTVFPLYSPGTDEFCAVMSRHMNLMTAVLPSQYYGTCRVWE